MTDTKLERGPMVGRMLEGDFEKDTITFHMPATYYLASGRYIIEPESDWVRRKEQLTALSARASAGEGGESEPPKYHCQNGSGHVCLAASLRPGNVVCPHDECDIDTGVFEMPTAAPQPAQAGASGGGDGRLTACIEGIALAKMALMAGDPVKAHERLNAISDKLDTFTTPASPATFGGPDAQD